MSARELVGILNDVFSVFDELVDRYDLEKVKTIGDAYMVVGGMSGHPTTTTRRAWLRWRSTWPMRSAGSMPPSAPASVPDRHPLRAGGRRCHRHEEVHLRHLGRHGEPREPDGVARHARARSR